MLQRDKKHEKTGSQCTSPYKWQPATVVKCSRLVCYTALRLAPNLHFGSLVRNLEKNGTAATGILMRCYSDTHQFPSKEVPTHHGTNKVKRENSGPGVSSSLDMHITRQLSNSIFSVYYSEQHYRI